MRNRNEILDEYNNDTSSPANNAAPLILELLLDVRDLLANPVMEISGTSISPVRLSEERPATPNEEVDALFDQAKDVVQFHGKVSAGLLQRELKIPYVYSAKLLDQLEAAGIIGPKEGAKPRKVL